MIIDSGSISMGSTRTYMSKSRSVSLAGWAQRSVRTPELLSDKKEMFRNQLNARYASHMTTQSRGVRKDDAAQYEKLRQKMLYEFLSRIHAMFQGMTKRNGNPGIMDGSGFSLYSYSYEEREETSFSTKGRVKCADGREIDFNIDLYMSRSFSQYIEERTEFTISPVAALCDPLVINLEDSIARVSDTKIRFDLDADGVTDEVSRLSAGSGYLALDKNGDGRVNDGNELFGTKSGDGFSDLAAFDADGNGWIDEADPVFDKLKIWITDENGNEKLYSLKDKGVGAIYLGNADTSFDLKNADNAINARIRKTGIFLYENGMAGTMQHLDLAKHGQYNK